MNALGLSSEELALQARARAFAREVVQPRAAGIDASEEYPWDIVKALTAARFVGMTIPTEYGGQGRSFLDAVLVIEEMAKCCTVTARIAVETNMGAVSTVMAYGSDEQKKLTASMVLSGDKPAICITEPDAGSDATGDDDARRPDAATATSSTAASTGSPAAASRGCT